MNVQIIHFKSLEIWKLSTASRASVNVVFEILRPKGIIRNWYVYKDVIQIRYISEHLDVGALDDTRW